jgi:putative endonuclease
MAINAHVLGRLGEQVAAWFYRLRGYRIVARNLRLATGEIDLVLRRARMLVVAEVKTRQSERAGKGFEAVDSAKRRKLIALGEQLLARERGATQLRYDIMSLQWTGFRFAVTHIPNAFQPAANPRQPWRLAA